jgi:hypothetical protein
MLPGERAKLNSNRIPDGTPKNVVICVFKSVFSPATFGDSTGHREQSFFLAGHFFPPKTDGDKYRICPIHGLS